MITVTRAPSQIHPHWSRRPATTRVLHPNLWQLLRVTAMTWKVTNILPKHLVRITRMVSYWHRHLFVIPIMFVVFKGQFIFRTKSLLIRVNNSQKGQQVTWGFRALFRLFQIGPGTCLNMSHTCITSRLLFYNRFIGPLKELEDGTPPSKKGKLDSSSEES